MKLSTVLICSLLFSFSVHAVEPTPKATTPTEEATESSGAIKVEKKPAVPKEKLDEQDALEKKSQNRKMENPSKETNQSAPHYFGLHASLGLPHPINYGLNYLHSSGLFSVEFSTGSFGATVSDVKAKIENTEIGLRWHPWASSFFVGALVGNQKISAEKTETIQGYSATAKVDIKSTYFTPHLGWFWGAHNGGFFTSLEIGAQLPSGNTTDISSNAPANIQADPEYVKNEKDVREQSEKVGKSTFPYVTLLKIGWLF